MKILTDPKETVQYVRAQKREGIEGMEEFHITHKGRCIAILTCPPAALEDFLEYMGWQGPDYSSEEFGAYTPRIQYFDCVNGTWIKPEYLPEDCAY